MENDGSMQWRLGALSGNETRRRKEENNRLIELLFSAAAAAATLRWARFRPKTRRRLRGARSSIEPFNRPHPRIRTSLEEKQPKATKSSPQSAPRHCLCRRRPINAVLQAFGGSARNACLIWGLASLKGVVAVNERLGQQKPPSLPRLMDVKQVARGDTKLQPLSLSFRAAAPICQCQ